MPAKPASIISWVWCKLWVLLDAGLAPSKWTSSIYIYKVIHSFFGKLGTQINHKIWVWEGWKCACTFGQASKLIIAQNIEGQNGQKRPPKLWAATAALESFALLEIGKCTGAITKLITRVCKMAMMGTGKRQGEEAGLPVFIKTGYS